MATSYDYKRVPTAEFQTTWECDNCGRRVERPRKPSEDCDCGDRKWGKVEMFRRVKRETGAKS